MTDHGLGMVPRHPGEGGGDILNRPMGIGDQDAIRRLGDRGGQARMHCIWGLVRDGGLTASDSVT